MIGRTSFDVTVPVSSGEFAVMRSLMIYAIPYMLAWDKVLGGSPRIEQDHAPPQQRSQSQENDEEKMKLELPSADIWGSNF